MATWDTVARSTGIQGEEWVRLLDPAHNHAQLADAALSHLRATLAAQPDGVLQSKNLEWWAQGVAVSFEQHIGRRVPGERCDGSFGANASKTVPGAQADIAAAWAEFAPQLPLILDGEPRISETAKWNYWRVKATSPTAPDGSSASVSMNIQSHTPGKTTVAAEVKGLTSPPRIPPITRRFSSGLSPTSRPSSRRAKTRRDTTPD